MKILISAYACEPNSGSESEIGWSWIKLHIKKRNKLYVITRKSNRKKILNLYEVIKKNKKLHLTGFLNFIIKKKIKIKCTKYDGKWYEFDDIEDYSNYKKKP